MNLPVNRDNQPAEFRRPVSRVAAGLAAAAVLGQLALHRGELSTRGMAMTAVSISVLLLAGVAWAVMLDKVLWILGTPGERAGRSWREFFAIGLWFAVTTAAVATWPRVCALDFELSADRGTGSLYAYLAGNVLRLRQIVPFYVTVTGLGVTAAALLVRWRRSEIAIRYLNLTGWVGLIFAFFILLAHTLTSLERFGYVSDFYFYICNARDQVEFGHAPRSRYAYFPGVYFFWEMVLRTTDGSLQSLQSALLLVHALNVLLLGAVVWRVAQSALAGLLAAVLYMSLAEQFDGFGGLTEPLCTVPFLAALVVWRGQPFCGHSGARRAIACGILLGLTVFFKQQAGLLTLGWLVLPAQQLIKPRASRHRLSLLLVIPLVAFLTLIGGILLRGEGLDPLRIGIGAVSTVPPLQESIEASRTSIIRRALSTFLQISFQADLLIIGALGIAAFLRIRPNAKYAADVGMREVWNFSMLAFVATLGQFLARPNLGWRHYGLLSVPCLIIVFVIGVVELYRYLTRVQCLSAVSQYLLGSLIALPVLIALPESLPERINSHGSTLRQPWHLSADGKRTVDGCRPFVEPAQDVLVLPPGFVELHFALGTRAASYPEGYAYALSPDTLSRVIGESDGPRVIVSYTGRLHYVDNFKERELALSLMQSSGFRAHAVTEDCTVWLRE